MTPKRTDANHSTIRDGLRAVGYQILDMHDVGRGFPDLLAVCKTGQIVLLEVKTASGKLNAEETEFFDRFRGPARIVRSLEDAITLMQTFDMFGDDGANPPGVSVVVDEITTAEEEGEA